MPQFKLGTGFGPIPEQGGGEGSSQVGERKGRRRAALRSRTTVTKHQKYGQAKRRAEGLGCAVPAFRSTNEKRVDCRLSERGPFITYFFSFIPAPMPSKINPSILACFLAATLLSISSCSEDYYEVNGYTGRASAILNERTEWTSNTILFKDANATPRYQLRMNVHNANYELRQTLLISNLSPSDQEIRPFRPTRSITTEERNTPNTYFSTVVADGDAICERYDVDTTYPNRVYIEAFNTDNFQIRGSFDLRFLRREPPGCTALPDTVHFRNGRFSVNGLSN